MKACPVLLRHPAAAVQILVFRHPLAGLQLVKGSIEPGENPQQTALRELTEEAGISDARPLRDLGCSAEIHPNEPWHFWLVVRPDLPDHWCHPSSGDTGERYEFFWHDLNRPDASGLEARYRRALRFVNAQLTNGDIE